MIYNRKLGIFEPSILVRNAGGLWDDVALGLVPDRRGFNKFGRNPDIDMATDPEDVWDGGGIWPQPTAPRIHNIASSDAADDPASTGAWTIRIFGLTSWDADGETSEDIELDGTNNVPTVNSYVIIYRMFVLTAGSGGVNAGTITATAVTDGTVTAQINIGNAQTLMAIYAVPSTQRLVLTQGDVVLNDNTSNQCSARLLVNTVPDVNPDLWRIADLVGLNTDSLAAFQKTWSVPAVIEGPCIVKTHIETVTNNNADVSSTFSG